MDLKYLEQQTEQASALLKALANEKRLMIVCILVQGEKNVGELEQFIGLSQSALSQHLARLRRDGIVDTRREAQTIYYSVKDKAVPKVLECLCSIYESMC
jgi:ArsR family transcriptional regulator, virulence genes transcriptional regulator